jgi:hypothetical protein
MKPEALEKIKNKWFPELQHHCPGSSVVLIGTHADLRSAADAIDPKDDAVVAGPISFADAEKFSADLGAVTYIEASNAVKGAENSYERIIDVIIQGVLQKLPAQVKAKKEAKKKKRDARCAVM